LELRRPAALAPRTVASVAHATIANSFGASDIVGNRLRYGIHGHRHFALVKISK
jgi:hypothetical protein